MNSMFMLMFMFIQEVSIGMQRMLRSSKYETSPSQMNPSMEDDQTKPSTEENQMKLTLES